MKVYVVAEGAYSDYHIEAVLSTKKQARNYIINHANEYMGYQIEEYELDNGYPETNDKLFEVTMNDGMWEVKDADGWYGCVTKGTRAFYHHEFGTYHNYIHAKDKEHALKIGQDDYAKLKAEKFGL